MSAIPGTTISVAETIVAPGPIVGDVGGKVGFYGSEGAEKVTLPANATDLASAEALVNAIKAAMIALGLAE